MTDKRFSVVRRAPDGRPQEISAGPGLLWDERILRWFRGIATWGRACQTAAGATVARSLGGLDPTGASGRLSTASAPGALGGHRLQVWGVRGLQEECRNEEQCLPVV